MKGKHGKDRQTPQPVDIRTISLAFEAWYATLAYALQIYFDFS